MPEFNAVPYDAPPAVTCRHCGNQFAEPTTRRCLICTQARDAFARTAMHVFLESALARNTGSLAGDVATTAYHYADAMMRERRISDRAADE